MGLLILNDASSVAELIMKWKKVEPVKKVTFSLIFGILMPAVVDLPQITFVLCYLCICFYLLIY